MSLSVSLKDVFKISYDLDDTNRLLNRIIEESKKSNELKSFTGRPSENSWLN